MCIVVYPGREEFQQGQAMAIEDVNLVFWKIFTKKTTLTTKKKTKTQIPGIVAAGWKRSDQPKEEKTLKTRLRVSFSCFSSNKK